MGVDLPSPRLQRSHKRAHSEIDSGAPPASKHAYPHPSRHLNPRSFEALDPRSAPSTKRRRLQSPTNDRQAARAASAPPWPTCTPATKHCRPQLTINSPVDAWISTVSNTDPRPSSPPSNRPSTCPATLDISKQKHTPPSLEAIKQVSQQLPQYGENVGTYSGDSQSGKPSTSHPLYRGTLFNNFVSLDYSGRRIPQELRTFADTKILKQRESPQLEDEAVSKVIDTAEELADSTEGPTAKLIRTDMFPFERPGLAEGGNSTWSTTPLPNNPEYQYNISAPKPDTHFGYPTNQRSGWSYAQSNAITHPVARSYAQPARGNTFPFLMVEMKSEVTRGTLYVAENQAAGSGSHSVNALLWLLQEAGTYDNSSLTDRIAFTITMSHREAIIYIHWYSDDDRRYYMSFLRSYSTVFPPDIRGCNNTVKNIIDHGLGDRKTAIGRALNALFPFPQHWKQVRPAIGTTSSTPATSSGEEARPSRKKKGKGSGS